jgi:hypothetical protein
MCRLTEFENRRRSKPSHVRIFLLCRGRILMDTNQITPTADAVKLQDQYWVTSRKINIFLQIILSPFSNIP